MRKHVKRIYMSISICRSWWLDWKTWYWREMTMSLWAADESQWHSLRSDQATLEKISVFALPWYCICGHKHRSSQGSPPNVLIQHDENKINELNQCLIEKWDQMLCLSTNILPWSTDQMKITWHVTTIIHYR